MEETVLVDPRPDLHATEIHFEHLDPEITEDTIESIETQSN